MTIYKTRYQAKKHMRGLQAIVKVDAGDGQIGYCLMDYRDYCIWRKQK